MEDRRKTMAQLVAELELPRRHVVELEDVKGHEENLTRIQEGFRTGLSSEIRWARSSSRPIERDGHVAGIQGVLADVTQQEEQWVTEAANDTLAGRFIS